MVKYLKNIEIDREKWDSCIEQAVFETLYPYSWYMDLVHPGWDALVKGDYEMIMPFTLTRKAGFRLMLQPILAQQLGVFAPQTPSAVDMEEFLTWITSRFRYVNICVNRENNAPPARFESRMRANYEIDLSNPGPEYNSNTKRNIQKGNTNPFEFREAGISEYLDLKYAPGQDIAVGREYMENLFSGLEKLKRVRAFGLFLNDDLQASAVLGYAKTRVIYMNGCSSPSGKETRAMFVLMDQLIKHSRDISPVFDFEGSDLPGVARFFEGFGGIKTHYQRIIHKKFPFTLLKI